MRTTNIDGYRKRRNRMHDKNESAENGRALRASKKAIQDVEDVEDELGPFVVAANATRMPMIFVNAKSKKHEIVYANQSFLDLTGYKTRDVIGLPFSLAIAASDRPYAALEAIASTAKSTIDIRCLKKDGTEFNAPILESPS